MSLVLAQSSQAEAWQRSSRFKYNTHRHNYHGHHSNRHNPHVSGNLVFPFSKGFIKISVGGKKFHYRDGSFYHKHHRHYTAVAAPIGACIAHLPYGFQNFYVDGILYYTYNDVYYKHTPDGYEVIQKPYSKHAEKYKVRSNHRHGESEDSITLNIRKKGGGYISIIVKPSGNGYVGPQGEYYDQFPKIEHLKLIYGS